jgi:AcrR family transcriptional regulator
MNKQPEVTAATKQKLIDAFWSLYEVKRIEKISIREITDRAGYNRGTFYVYFKDVYDLLEQLELAIIPRKENFEHAIISLNKNSSQAFKAMIEICNKNANYYNVLLGKHGDPNFYNEMKQITKSMFCDYLKCHDLYTESIELEYYIEYTISAMIGIIIHWFQSNKQISLEQFTEIHSKILTTRLDELLHLKNDTFPGAE